MSDPTTDSAVDPLKLARAVRFAIAAMVVAAAVLNLRATMQIGLTEHLFKDMLIGRPLPGITQFVLSARYLLYVVALAIQIIALLTLFRRNVVQSIYVLGCLGALAVIQLMIVQQGLYAPLQNVLSSMAGP